MKDYLITGPESLLKAASEEAQCVFPMDKTCSRVKEDTVGLMMGGNSLWFTINNFKNVETLALPADWDKFMGILSELKKPKLAEYVEHNLSGKVYKVNAASVLACAHYHVYDVMGRDEHIGANCTPITEREFIEGGLQELDEAGYVKGAKAEHVNSDIAKTTTLIDCVVYHGKKRNGPISDLSIDEVTDKGFSFSIRGGGLSVPVGKCTLIPALPTTSQGIPYTINGGTVYYGCDQTEGQIQRGILRHLLKQGVTEIVTKAGRLTQADLELLTK